MSESNDYLSPILKIKAKDEQRLASFRELEEDIQKLKSLEKLRSF
ncbi:hypothetical protein [Sulfurimonas denitrificans]|nr:hypothetical protein [Sulfurimonas denitrificans]MDD3443050.1 hypothetical protein [Sulfurimonas denitrificans]